MTDQHNLISRMDAIQACQVGPSDEWSRATKSGYSQAATDCQMNILRIPAVPSVGVTVKPLEWEEIVNGRWLGTPPVKLGDLVFWIFPQHGGYVRHVTDKGAKGYPTLEAAKAAAQADYEARILAALDVQPAHAKPDWIDNCEVCNRIVDTREKAEGGDGHGCQYGDKWACSSACAEVLSPDPDRLRDALVAPEGSAVPPAPDVAQVRAKALDDAAKACDRIAGNTADYPRDHRRAAGQCAAMIRSLITAPPAPSPDVALVEALEKLDGDSLDAMMEVIGEGSDFATYNRGKNAMREWFLRRISAALAQKGGDA